jgi:hypothetical protein
MTDVNVKLNDTAANLLSAIKSINNSDVLKVNQKGPENKKEQIEEVLKIIDSYEIIETDLSQENFEICYNLRRKYLSQAEGSDFPKLRDKQTERLNEQREKFNENIKKLQNDVKYSGLIKAAKQVIRRMEAENRLFDTEKDKMLLNVKKIELYKAINGLIENPGIASASHSERLNYFADKIPHREPTHKFIKLLLFTCACLTAIAVVSAAVIFTGGFGLALPAVVLLGLALAKTAIISHAVLLGAAAFGVTTGLATLTGGGAIGAAATGLVVGVPTGLAIGASAVGVANAYKSSDTVAQFKKEVEALFVTPSNQPDTTHPAVQRDLVNDPALEVSTTASNSSALDSIRLRLPRVDRPYTPTEDASEQALAAESERSVPGAGSGGS